MSKEIKQMQMASLQDTFKEVRDLVVLSVRGLDCHADHTLRSALRKKNIRLQVVKNTLTRKVFGEMGMAVGGDSPLGPAPAALRPFPGPGTPRPPAASRAPKAPALPAAPTPPAAPAPAPRRPAIAAPHR